MKDDFYEQIEAVGNTLPPVELWDPPLSGKMDCLIKRDGSWWIDTEPVQNKRLIRLYSTVLKREGEEYFLITPVEKWQIQVEDLPFLVVELEIQDKLTTAQTIRARTNVGDWLTIDSEHQVDTSPIAGLAEEQAIPYVHVRSNLMARLNRNTYLEITELLQPLADKNQYSLLSANTKFQLSL